ncbi:MAG: hypothetical protein Q8922_15180 [Bacteroidota bacterium]|nr:hypothetical protein [Bacteroidota bacterium]MDP4231751.1 hypothetical protein [Bacteroidota bacterium]MDP4243487.1 hypothetical protein [Bacteroidota bacterium]MDP4289259.1 hypothetical protein [Bacteroidota bacterium]
MRPIFFFMLIIGVASCGTQPRGEVTITLKSGEQQHVRFLAVEQDAVVVRSEPWGDLSRIRIGDIASVERPGAVSPLAVIAGGILGAALGGWQASSNYTYWSASHQVKADFRSIDALPVQPPASLAVLAVAELLTGTALGIWAGTFIHKPGTQVSTDDSDVVAKLRSLALFPNGMPRIARDSSAQNNR